MRTFLYAPLLALAAAATQAQAATPPQIGTAAVTKNDVTGALGGKQRALKRGDTSTNEPSRVEKYSLTNW